MKVILAIVSISLALPGLAVSNSFAQAAAGGGGGAAGGAGAGGAGIRGSATASGATAAPTGRIAPTGVLAGQAATPGTAALSSPAAGQLVTGGQTIAPGTSQGTLNPGQLSATPPNINGRTFDRVPIVGAPTDTVIDPSRAQPTFQFPPESTLPQSVVTNTGVGGQFDSGLPDAAIFPPGEPVRVGNTVGANFGSTLGVAPEPVVVDLPPGARITTNAFGVPEVGVAPVVVAPPAIVPADTGRGPTFESSSSRSSTQPQVPRQSAPPRNAPIAPR
jgi:hypothetical protein